MNVTVDITTTAELQGLFRRAASLPQESLKAIARALTASKESVVGNIMKERIVLAKGPFPVAQNKLGKRSGQLNKSVRATNPQIQEGSSTVTIGFGSRLKYFAIHEFGGEVKRKARSQVNNFRFLADGKRVRFAKVKDATFSQKNQIGASSFIMPARAPVRTELNHPRTLEAIFPAIEREIRKVISDIEKGGPA